MLKLTKIQLVKQGKKEGKKINLEKSNTINLRKNLKVSKAYSIALNLKYNLVK